MDQEDEIDFGEPDGTPDFRVTINGERLMLTPSFPWLARSGPLGKLARDRGKDGVFIADVTIDGDELLVHVHASPPDPEAAEGRLLEWAATVGYARVWLPSRLVDLAHAAVQVGPAAITCDSCGIEWDDPTPELWEQVRSDRRFPTCCPICGTDLPQWQTKKPTAQRVSRSPRARRSSQRPSPGTASGRRRT